MVHVGQSRTVCLRVIAPVVTIAVSFSLRKIPTVSAMDCIVAFDINEVGSGARL